MVRSFNFSHELKGKSIKTVYLIIFDWLDREGVKIERMAEYYEIVGVHGKGWILVWERNAKKTLKFRLTEASGSVVVEVEATPSRLYYDDVPGSEDEIEASWSSLLNELWASIEGGELANKYLKTTDKMREEAKIKRIRSTRFIIIGLILVIIPILLIVGFVEYFGAQDNLLGNAAGILTSIPVIIGALMILLGIFDLISSIYDFKLISKKEKNQ